MYRRGPVGGVLPTRGWHSGRLTLPHPKAWPFNGVGGTVHTDRYYGEHYWLDQGGWGPAWCMRGGIVEEPASRCNRRLHSFARFADSGLLLQ